ncbi:MAG: HlyD family secretion protein [Hyphomicrobiales bacterium]
MDNVSNNIEHPKSKRRHNITLIIVLVILIIVIVYFYRYFTYRLSNTDAQIDSNVIPVVNRVSAFVDKVSIKENTSLKKGSTTLVLDTIGLNNNVQLSQIELEQADIAMDIAQIELENAILNKNIAKANLSSAKVNNWKAKDDYKRQTELFDKGIITKDIYNNVVNAKSLARSQYMEAKYQLKQAEILIKAKKAVLNQAKSKLKSAKVAFENARINKSYAFVKSPISGIVSNLNLKEGQFVQAGQTLFNVVDVTDIWITANFKETQIRFLYPKKEVEVKIDAYPSARYKAYVESVGPAANSKYALIPPSNASGNFVKVVQRFAVKMRFSKGQKLPILKPGMNVKVIVHKN